MSEILYHYCSTEAFHSIVTSKSVWLSALSLSNDTTEGALVLETVCAFLEELEIGDRDIEAFRKQYKRVADETLVLGFCMSKERDLLSQWRGYADGGRGVAIGFSEDELVHSLPGGKLGGLPVYAATPARYTDKNATIDPIFEQIYELHGKGALVPFLRPTEVRLPADPPNAWGILQRVFRQIAMVSHSYKHPAFEEEQEIRLIAQLDSSLHCDDGIRLCRFRPVGGRLVPYLPVQIDPSTVQSVTLGPQHTTPREYVQAFLSGAGCERASVERSRVPYRSH